LLLLRDRRHGVAGRRVQLRRLIGLRTITTTIVTITLTHGP
jgi:hypothetical protein